MLYSVRRETTRCWRRFMAEVLVGQDVEAVVVKALAVEGLRASTKVPNPRPTTFVRVRVRGGSRADSVLEGSLLLLECWSTKEADAYALARLVAGVVVSLAGQTVDGTSISHAELLGGPSNDPDPDSQTPRYTLTCQIYTFATGRKP